MRKTLIHIFICFLFITRIQAANVITGAERLDQYLPLLKGKTVGLVVNQTSIIGSTHLLDTLLSLGVNIQRIFGPEHGFRGTGDAGEHISSGTDPITHIAVVSLYGDNKKPTGEQLKDLDIIIYDIQDVGVRFYTFISTLQYMMEACAENKKPLLLLDRPNPNGHYVAGPVLDTQNRSFVGMQPIPVVYGMTMGEYAKMLNGEKWLDKKAQCKLTVIPCKNYDHNTFYLLPVKPSPNLPNMTAIYLYPSLCFFEGTNTVSVGRGTDKPFQVYGSPEFPDSLFSFTPMSKPGATKPFLQDKKCNGYDLSNLSYGELRKQHFTLNYLLHAYQLSKDKSKFFNSFFLKLAGKSALAVQINKGLDEKAIKKTWQPQLAKFKAIRKKYLLYKDFE